MMEKVLKFVFAAALLCGLVAFGSCQEVEFGHHCSTTAPLLRCNSSKPYACRPVAGVEKCGCRDGADVMHYDDLRRTCVVNAEADGCLQYASGGNLVPVQCTANAECSSTTIDQPGTCHCIPGTAKEGDGHLCKPGYAMGPCTGTRDCLSPSTNPSFLLCESNTCTCRANSTWINDKCRGLIGGTCNADEALPPGPCSPTMDCAPNNICACKSTHQETTDGRCLLKLGEACTGMAECHPDFPQCVNSTVGGPTECRCATGHEEKGGRCYILADQPCNLPNNNPAICNIYSHCDETETKCICDPNYAQVAGHCKGLLNATCSTPPDDCHTALNLVCHSNTTQCHCTAGYIGAGNGGCLANYNTTCTNNDNCHPDFPICHKDTPEAPTGTCGCDEDRLYDDGRCLILAGKNCSQPDAVCLPNSHCNEAPDPVCECDTNYHQVGDVCKGGSGATCRPSSIDCDPDRYLRCDDNNVCVCNVGYELQDDGSCKGEPKVPCREDANCLTEYCPEAPSRVCECRPGSIYANNRCENFYGGSCDPACHSAYRLDCDQTNGTCTCADKAHYEPSKNTVACLSMAGEACGHIDDCIISSYCNLVCTCEPGFSNSNGLCVKGSASTASAATFTIILSFIVAITNFKV